MTERHTVATKVAAILDTDGVRDVYFQQAGKPPICASILRDATRATFDYMTTVGVREMRVHLPELGVRLVGRSNNDAQVVVSIMSGHPVQKSVQRMVWALLERATEEAKADREAAKTPDEDAAIATAETVRAGLEAAGVDATAEGKVITITGQQKPIASTSHASADGAGNVTAHPDPRLGTPDDPALTDMKAGR